MNSILQKLIPLINPKSNWNDTHTKKLESILESKTNLISQTQRALEFLESPELIQYQNELYLVEMSTESPQRRSFCYDQQARIERKKFAPENSAQEWCIKNGVELVDKEFYFYLQELKDIDLKTSSWLKTPKEIRALGGAIFGDKRYNQTFIYHNSADSYYSVRGFRVYLKLT
ncbi:DUF4256 domain-containing protein [Mycoplasmopsis pullorum]|uniref:DUF4256 domain-containing protein n=2 Tax=Mycoplasmopsis pullorum TaxID=48003 RepID=UPI001119C84F|nr:DUF4256 domain-containing protein [Mycoplasmopsis pullorum]TNK91765.1 DUF4256 domain-containing protein [Mycoplasmopsis pullorum]